MIILNYIDINMHYTWHCIRVWFVWIDVLLCVCRFAPSLVLFVISVLLYSLVDILYYCWLFWFWLSGMFQYNYWLFGLLCLNAEFKPPENRLCVFILVSVRNVLSVGLLLLSLLRLLPASALFFFIGSFGFLPL